MPTNKPAIEPALVPAKLLKTTDETKERAKAMYLEHAHLNDIAKELKISTSVIAKWRNEEDWALARTNADAGFLEDVTQGRKIRISRLAEMSIEQLERGIHHLKQRVEPLSIPEMEKMTMVLTNLHKIGRLDADKSTENVAVKLNVAGQLSLDDIARIIKSDEFTAPEK